MATSGNGVRREVPLTEVTPEQLDVISRNRCLALNRLEMETIRWYFKGLHRQPTDVELECLAQTWSEHCKHKVFQATIDFDGPDGKETIEGLFPSYIVKATEEVRKARGDKDFCVSVFKDNAGVIRFDGLWCVAFKVETHNHPSALDPYGGAATGIGGVIRDILGTGLGAKPVANTDVFCVGPVKMPFSDLPPGALHPRRILKGVVEGVRDYGNRMGIATVNGSVQFSPRYLGNPLVFCGTVGLIPEEDVPKGCRPGDILVSIGGRTGRDGLHGATFSSLELHEESAEMSGGAVQIGNPVVEKRAEEAVLRARNENLLTDCTDCGAGGFSSAVGEMAKKYGAVVDLDQAPLKYAGLDAWEIFLSEAQERMVVALRPENLERLDEICHEEAVEWSHIATVTNTGHLVVEHQGEVVCDLEMDFLHNGLPPMQLKAVYKAKSTEEPQLAAEPEDLTKTLLKVLQTPDVCSKEWIIRQYDHEVQGGSVTKPIQGKGEGPGDAAVWNPIADKDSAVVISHGINVRYGPIDPYSMAGAVIDEALRGVVAAGGDPDYVAILDNFCMGSPENPEILGELVQIARGCYDFAIAYGLPFISGKDSFYNQFQRQGETIAVPPTLLVSAIGVLKGMNRARTSDFKKPGSSVYLLGRTRAELGGSCYYQTLGIEGVHVPETDAKANLALYRALSQAVGDDLALAIHDLSDGGLGVALAEMSIGGHLGLEADIEKIKTDKKLEVVEKLFSESTGRFVVEVASGKESDFEAHLGGLPIARIGKVTENSQFTLKAGQKTVVNTTVEQLAQAWRKPFQGW